MECENSVIGGLLIPNADPKFKQEVFDLITPEMFWSQENKFIYAELKTLFKSGSAVDFHTALAQLEKARPDDKMLMTYLGEKIKDTPSAANLLSYSDVVKDMFYKRELYSKCIEAQDLINQGEESEVVMSTLENELIELSKVNGADDIEHVNDISDAWLNEMERRMQSGGEITGQETGFEDLDAALLGLNEDDLVVVAGKSGTGKTLFSQAITRHVAIRDNKPTLFFSMEMSRVQVYERFVSGESGVNPSDYRSAKLNDSDWSFTMAASNRIKESGLHIVSRPALSIGQIRGMARKFKSRNPEMGLIVIDYLTKMTLPKADRRDIAIGEVTGALKEMAQELKCPVILLSQMNRGNDRMKGQRPQMTDLKDSSSIEQDADVIIMLHREGRLNEFYPKDLLEVLIRKSRHVDAEKTVYLRCVNGGYQKVAEHEAVMQIEKMANSNQVQTSGGGF